MGDAGVSHVISEVLDRVTAACVDGRCRNVRYRQNQLHLLHAYLRSNINGILHATQQDSGNTESEAVSEYYLALSSVSQVYDQLDFEQSMEGERKIAAGRNDDQRRVPHGIVVIRPGENGRFFSMMAPLAAAVAAGNCVLFELPQTLRLLEPFIRGAINSMDHDAFAATTSKIADEHFLSKCFVVDQNEDSIKHTGAPHNIGVGINLAVVHRDADVTHAARSICTARFRFKGQSPYAPDVVLVNEWTKKNFVQAFLQIAAEEDATLLSEEKSSGSTTKLTSPDPALNTETYKVLYQSPRTQLLELRERHPDKIYQIRGRTLVILAVNGLVDAISVASNLSPVTICYVFAGLKDANFIRHQVDSRVTFVNEIPVRLLVGPVVVPSTENLSPQLRYDTTMMSKPQPAYVGTSSEYENMLFELLATKQRTSTETARALEQLRILATKPLIPTGQASGTSMGFFDQGILTGLVAFVLPIIGLASTGVFFAGKYAFRQFYCR